MQDKLKKIKAITMDVDGVLTDGLMLATSEGDLLRMFDAKDGFGLRMATMHGYILGVITGASSVSIKKRMMTCGVKEENIYLHSRIKIEDFQDFCSRNGLEPEEVMYIGDDVPDIPVMEACGIGVAPADAVPEALAAADYIASCNGGKRLVRHCIELVMKAQDEWVLDCEAYKKNF